MSFKISASARFDKELKRLTKKYSSLKQEYASLIKSLEVNPIYGTPIKHHCYKIRVAIASKGKGKRSGARVITYVHVKGEVVYLLTIFDKSEVENISDKELQELLDEIEDL